MPAFVHMRRVHELDRLFDAQSLRRRRATVRRQQRGRRREREKPWDHRPLLLDRHRLGPGRRGMERARQTHITSSDERTRRACPMYEPAVCKVDRATYRCSCVSRCPPFFASAKYDRHRICTQVQRRVRASANSRPASPAHINGLKMRWFPALQDSFPTRAEAHPAVADAIAAMRSPSAKSDGPADCRRSSGSRSISARDCCVSRSGHQELHASRAGPIVRTRCAKWSSGGPQSQWKS